MFCVRMTFLQDASPQPRRVGALLPGGRILPLGATRTLVARNSVAGNRGRQFNSGGIVVLSARQISGGSNPNFDTIARNTAFRDRPADLRWDGTGTGVRFLANQRRTSAPSGLTLTRGYWPASDVICCKRSLPGAAPRAAVSRSATAATAARSSGPPWT
jgi:hypothetical protein